MIYAIDRTPAVVLCDSHFVWLCQFIRCRGLISEKKLEDFDFDIVKFPIVDGDVPRPISYGVYISQFLRFARVSSHVADLNTRNKRLLWFILTGVVFPLLVGL